MRSCALVVVHVQPGTTPVAADAQGLDLLRASGAFALREESTISVTTRLVRGNITDELISLSQDAALLVIGIDRSRSRASHGALGPIEDRLAVHAQCPVIIVAPMQGELQPPSRIVLGWSSHSPANDRVFIEATTEARVRGARLDVIIVEDTETKQHRDQDDPLLDRRSLAKIIEELDQSFAGLVVRTHHLQGELASSLASQAVGAELLVIGCHHSSDHWSIRAGTAALDLMYSSPCPLMLVGNQESDPS